MSSDLVTRPALVRALAVNAATRRLNLAVPLAVGAAAVLLQTVWLLPLAVVVYVALAVSTFFDADEAERVGRVAYERRRLVQQPALDAATLSPQIARKLGRARAEETRIREAIERAPLPRYDVLDEVARLMVGLEKLAARAQQIQSYLDEQDDAGVRERLRRFRSVDPEDAAVTHASSQAAAALEEQLAVTAELERHLARFDAQMEHAAASLAAIHGQIVRMGAAEEAVAQRDVASDVRSLRRDVNVIADALRETYDELADDES
jgi:hypothetical protein